MNWTCHFQWTITALWEQRKKLLLVLFGCFACRSYAHKRWVHCLPVGFFIPCETWTISKRKGVHQELSKTSLCWNCGENICRGSELRKLSINQHWFWRLLIFPRIWKKCGWDYSRWRFVIKTCFFIINTTKVPCIIALVTRLNSGQQKRTWWIIIFQTP